ncbi:MAG: hypothetical protein JHC98_01745 [Thermoleophilaceae bacterium]|nr:hypothetical protein [Thermoleophilaceae bacterium]
MEFRRRGIRTFVSDDGGFSVRRPSGPSVNRNGLWLKAPGHNYEIRMRSRELWLLDGEREVGYADGMQSGWTVLFDERALELVQPKTGVPHTLVHEAGAAIGQFAGTGFPMRSFRGEGELGTTAEQTAFLAMIVLTGWRESDRAMLVATGGG